MEEAEEGAVGHGVSPEASMSGRTGSSGVMCDWVCFYLVGGLTFMKHGLGWLWRMIPESLVGAGVRKDAGWPRQARSVAPISQTCEPEDRKPQLPQAIRAPWGGVA